MPGLRERALLAAVALGDRLTPVRSAVVVRTGPDFDDQGRQTVRALADAGVADVTWLVSGTTDPGPPGPVPCAVLPARSAAGIRAFWRAGVVVHTHGVYGSRRAGRRKRWVNIWHGMPIKRLEAASAVGRHQTTVTIATAPVHAEHLAATWGLAAEQVAIVGLPRNDVLVRSAGGRRPDALRRLVGDRPLVVWLPTFRTNAGGPARADGGVDGVDTGTASQFAGASTEAADALFGRLGVHAVLKPHPLAPPPTRASLPNLEVWTDDDVRAAGLTLYELLAHADVLVSDHSSVWVDFLLVDRPMVFAVSDLDEYASSRGFYFDDLPGLLPGPLVTDLDGLEAALAAALAGDDGWASRRAEARGFHHTHTDAGAADRVAALVVEQLGALSAPTLRPS